MGLSEAVLAHRTRLATDPAEFAALAAEAHRQQLLAELFPDGRLAGDLSGFPDEALGWAVLYARADEAERLAAEADRRHPVQLPPDAAERGIEGSSTRPRRSMRPSPRSRGRPRGDGLHSTSPTAPA